MVSLMSVERGWRFQVTTEQSSFYAFNGRTSNSDYGFVIRLGVGVKPNLDNHSFEYNEPPHTQFIKTLGFL